MQHAALQLHTVGQERRGALAPEAIVPALTLYAALSLAFASMLGLPPYIPALLVGAAAAAPVALAPARWSRILLLAALAFSLGAAALPFARSGAAVIANRLYDASEAVNAYAYDYFEVPDTASPHAALAWLTVFGGALCAFAARRRIGALMLFLAAAFVETYFGITPPVWQNLLLFALLALLLAQGRNGAQSAALLAGIVCVALAVCLLAPRPNAAVEAYSEHLRDELGVAAQSDWRPLPQPEAENEPVHQESRQREELAASDAAGEQNRAFERQTETEQELSLPRRVDYVRIALLLLLTAAVLLVPFLPFLLLNRARRCAADRRAAFGDPDNAAAIRAMFAHTMRWLRACGLQTENRPFALCKEAVAQMTSEDYAAQYAQAVAIWQEAAYSAHGMDEEQRAAVRALLDRTEKTLYERADRRTKLRLKYKECLCEV